MQGARCEKPLVLVAGGQNRRFSAVSEVRNGRFCRLFAYGFPDSANNRVFWPWGCEESPILTTAGQNWRFFAVRTRCSVRLTIRGPVFVLACVDGGATVASSRRWADRKPCPRHPTLPGCGLRDRRLPVSRSDQRASSAATPPRALEGQGQRAIRGCSIGGPLAAWPNCGPCAEYSPPKFIGGLSLTVMDGRQTLRHPSAAAWAACRRPLRSFSFPYTISACRRRA